MNQSLSQTATVEVDDPADVDGTAGSPAEAAATGEDAAAIIEQLREQIDEVDAELVSIVKRRIALSKQIQAVRMAHGGRRREHSRELKIVNTYVEGLGRGGSQLALTLLELSRGRA